jgi:hypothetical protein
MTLPVGCAGWKGVSASRSTPPHTRPRVVFSPAHVERPREPVSQLKGGAGFISRDKLAFMTSGSNNCYWWPTRVTILSRHAVRVDMRMAVYGSGCVLNLVSFPIAVEIGHGLVDTDRPVTVRLAYAAHYGGGEGTKRWQRTFVAPPFAHD